MLLYQSLIREFQYVATVLTVYGIETPSIEIDVHGERGKLQQYLPFTVLKPKKATKKAEPSVATVLTVYGIETLINQIRRIFLNLLVATVLTVYGIETCEHYKYFYCAKIGLLQQYLPFTVLKPFCHTIR